jgi:transcriptional regulator with XRE-family HTH domain
LSGALDFASSRRIAVDCARSTAMARSSFNSVPDKRTPKENGFDAEACYRALARVVQARHVPWRQVARETGVTPSTLSRMAHGRRPDAPSLAVLSAWASINPANFVRRPTSEQSREPMAAISTLLKTDPDLTPEEAAALEQIIRLAYTRITRHRP